MKCYGCSKGSAVNFGLWCAECRERQRKADEIRLTTASKPRPSLVTGLFFALLAAFLALPASAQTPDPDGPRVSVTAGGLVTMSADAGTAVTPMVFVEVESPISIGKKSPLRFYGRLGIGTAPGTSVDLSQPQTFKSAEFGGGLAYTVGEHVSGVRTQLVAEAGGATRLPGDPEPLNRVLHYFGFGMRLGDTVGNSLTVLVGRDQVADQSPADPLPDGTIPHAPGLQAVIYGSLNVPATNGVVTLIGDATINLTTPDTPGVRKRDVIRLGSCVDIARVFSLLSKPRPAAAPATPVPAATLLDSRFGPPAPSHLVAEWVREGRAGVR